MESGSVILQTPSTREEVLCFAVHRNSAGLTTPARVKPSKWTSRPHCGPSVLVRFSDTHTIVAFYGGRPVADLWFCDALWVAGLSLTKTLSPSSSRSNTSRWASGDVLIEPSNVAFRHTTDSSSSSSLHTFFYLATSHWTKPFATESTVSKQGSERCGLQVHTTATAKQHTPCLPKTPALWLRVPECCDNDSMSPTSVGQSTHCDVSR